MSEANPNLEGLNIATIAAPYLGAATLDAMQIVKTNYADHFLGETQSREWIDDFTRHTTDRFAKPEESFGSSPDVTRVYRNPEVTVIYGEDLVDVKGYIATAMTASSGVRLPERTPHFPKDRDIELGTRRVIAEGKLRLAQLSKNYLWIRDLAHEPDIPLDELLVYITAASVKDSQNMTLYPLHIERELYTRAHYWGFHETDRHIKGRYGDMYRLEGLAGIIKSRIAMKPKMKAIGEAALERRLTIP